MIQGGEIHKKAAAHGIGAPHIENDYVLSWLLWGVANNDFLRENLIFKGGTCLKKVHFEVYRFSEDLDFTLANNEISDADLLAAFEQVYRDIFDNARIRVELLRDSLGVYAPNGSIHFYSHYTGPLGGNGDDIKVDITRGEHLIFDVQNSNVYQEYSDLLEYEDTTLKCYSLEEVLIEKMTALMGRMVPRDLYDFNYLTEVEGIEIADVFYEFEEKARHKKRDPNQFIEVLQAKEAKYKGQWNTNLVHQIKNLDKFDDVWRSVKKQLRKVAKLQGN